MWLRIESIGRPLWNDHKPLCSKELGWDWYWSSSSCWPVFSTSTYALHVVKHCLPTNSWPLYNLKCIDVYCSDSTAEYISGEEVKLSVGDMYQSGLQCVTVLIGVFDRISGQPIVGVINQPFHTQHGSRWVLEQHWMCSSCESVETSVKEWHSKWSPLLANINYTCRNFRMIAAKSQM
jgi:hypothetical protein